MLDVLPIASDTYDFVSCICIYIQVHPMLRLCTFSCRLLAHTSAPQHGSYRPSRADESTMSTSSRRSEADEQAPLAKYVQLAAEDQEQVNTLISHSHKQVKATAPKVPRPEKKEKHQKVDKARTESQRRRPKPKAKLLPQSDSLASYGEAPHCILSC